MKGNAKRNSILTLHAPPLSTPDGKQAIFIGLYQYYNQRVLRSPPLTRRRFLSLIAGVRRQVVRSITLEPRTNETRN